MAFTAEQRAKAAETRRRKAEERRQRQELAGIPDSRPPIAAEGSFPEPAILNCHVGGVPVRELPQPVQDKILYAQTDEAIEERNARPNVRADAGRVQVGAEAVDKERLQYRDDRKERRMPKNVARDPMGERVRRYVPPGMRGKFLSASRGGVDDLDGYQVVLDEKGQPVKYKTMTLGMIPEDEARERKSSARRKDHTRIKQTELLADERRIRMQRGEDLPPITPGGAESREPL
jgi:hypothetical protein